MFENFKLSKIPKKTIKKNVIGLVVIAIVVAFAYLRNENTDTKLLNLGKYKIGEIVEVFGMKGGTACRYKYEVNGIEYISTNYLGSSKVKNKKYFIIYLPSNPEKSKIFLEIQVPDSLRYSKKSWNKIPVKYDEKAFEKEFK